MALTTALTKAAWLLLLALLQCGRPARAVVRVLPPPLPDRWEGFMVHLSATLRLSQQMTSMHVVCRSAARCASVKALRRLDRQTSTAYTLTVADRLPSDWPVAPTNLFVLVGLDCAAIANVSLHLNDVVLLASHRPQEAFLPKLAVAFETCWRLDLLNAVAVHGGDRAHRAAGAVLRRSRNGNSRAAATEALPVYTYFPYRAGYCHDMRPILVASWTPSSPRRPAAVGLLPKLRDLGGCPLRLTVVKARPWLDFVAVNTSANFKISGTLAPLVATLAKYLNFTPQYILPLDKERYGSPLRYPNFGGLLGDVFHNRSDAALMFSGADLFLPFHGRPNTAQVCCVTWCLPTGYWQPSIWRPIVGEFTEDVWGLVLASYLLGTLSYRFFLRGSALADTWLTALQGLISGVANVPADWSPRMFLFCWSFFGLVLTTLYVAALHGINNVQASDTVFRTLSDIIPSPLPLYAAKDQIDSIQRAQFDDPRETALVRRIRKFEYDKALELYQLFFTRRDRGVLMYRSACLAYGTMVTPPRQTPRFHIIHNYCLFISAAYDFVMRRRSPLLPGFTTATNKLDEAGITLHWSIKPGRSEASQTDTVLRWRQVRPFLRMLGIGNAAATLVFILELLVRMSRWCGNRTSVRAIQAKKVTSDAPRKAKTLANNGGIAYPRRDVQREYAAYLRKAAGPRAGY